MLLLLIKQLTIIYQFIGDFTIKYIRIILIHCNDKYKMIELISIMTYYFISNEIVKKKRIGDNDEAFTGLSSSQFIFR